MVLDALKIVIMPDGWVRLYGNAFLIAEDAAAAVGMWFMMRLMAPNWQWHWRDMVKGHWTTPRWLSSVVQHGLLGGLYTLQVCLSVTMYRTWGGYVDAIQVLVQLMLAHGLIIVASEIAGYVAAKSAPVKERRRLGFS